MARGYKIKSYKRIYRRSIGSIIMKWLLAIGALALLFLLGWKLYEPITELFDRHSQENQTVLEQEEEIPTETPEETPETLPEQLAESAPAVTTPTENTEEKPAEETVEATEPVELAEASSRTAYFPMERVLNSGTFSSSLANVKAAGMDSVMIDLKSEEGWVNYPISYKEGYDDYYTASETISLEEVAQQIKDAGMTPIASIYTFKDRRFQQAETYAGILYNGTDSFWLDNSPDAGGKSWLNPYSPLAREYICKLIDDAAEAGFTEIVLREFNFPVGASMDQMRFVYDEGQSKLDCLKEAAAYFRQHAAEKGLHLWIEFPADALNGGDTRPYGGDAAELLSGNIFVDLSAVQSDSLSETISAVQAKAGETQLGAMLSVSGSSDNQLQSQILALQKAGISRYMLKY